MFSKLEQDKQAKKKMRQYQRLQSVAKQRRRIDKYIEEEQKRRSHWLFGDGGKFFLGDDAPPRLLHRKHTYTQVIGDNFYKQAVKDHDRKTAGISKAQWRKVFR